MSDSTYERIIERLLDIIEMLCTQEDREGIDAVIAGFDASREEDD